MHVPQEFIFGLFRLDPLAHVLWKGEEQVRLQKTPFQVLCYLAEHANKLVTKEELRKAVWGETVVSNAAIAQSIQRVRTAFGDDVRKPTFIETVHGQGWRFIGQGETSQTAEDEHPAPRLVGRALELQKLHRWFAKAQQGKRQFVFVTGERGVGKTALVNEFLSSIGQLSSTGHPQPLPDAWSLLPELWIGHGQCVEEYGPREPYRPLLEALTQLCRRDDSRRIVGYLKVYAPSWVRELPTVISSEDGANLPPQDGVEYSTYRMLRELAEALEKIAQERPLVLVVEDLHWSDPSTLDALGYLARRKEEARLLLVGTYRPEEAQTQNNPPTTLQRLEAVTAELESHRQCETLPVELFTAAAVRQYLTAAWGEASFIEDVAYRIHEHTEGNALFVVHVVDELVRQEIVSKEEGKWGLKGDVARITMPRTLQALIEKDVRQLPDMEQRALETASVAGMEFAVAVVAAALQKSVEEIEAVYEEIARKHRFLQEDTPVEWPDGVISGRYQFRHRLYKDVLYRRIAEVRRIRLHRRIAEREESGYRGQTEDRALELAEHFERGRRHLKAVHYFQLAARNALRRRSAPVEAIALSQQGLELLKGLPKTTERTSEEIELQITLGNALIAAGSLSDPRVGQAFARAQTLCEQVNNLSQRFRALFWLRRYHNHRGENREATKRAHELVQLAEKENDPALLTLAYLSIGETLWYGADLVTAKEYLEKSIASYDPVQHHALTALCGTDPISGSMIYRAICLWFLGYLDQALQLADEALTFAHDFDHPFSVAFIKLHTTIASHALRKPHEVQTRAEEVIKLSTAYGFAFYRALGTILKGWALVMQGDEKGLAYAYEGWKDLQAIEVGVGQTWALALLADICRMLARPEEGLEAIGEALDLVTRTGEHFYEAELYRLRGELVWQQASAKTAKSRKPTKREHASRLQEKKRKVSYDC